MTMKFGELVRVKRAEVGLNQLEFAELVGGIKGPYISQIETGNRRPKLELALRIAKALDAETELMDAWKAERPYKGQKAVQASVTHTSVTTTTTTTQVEFTSAQSIFDYVKGLEARNAELIEQMSKAERKLVDMQNENDGLRRMVREYKEDKDELDRLLGVIEQRRNTGARFTMDRNGNIERMA